MKLLTDILSKTRGMVSVGCLVLFAGATVLAQGNPGNPLYEPYSSHRDYAPIVYMDLPQPIGGYSAIQNNIVYPDTAIVLGLEGSVIIKCIIDIDGLPQDITPILGPELLFDAAIDAVRHSYWEPARVDRHPVLDTFSFSVDFVLPENVSEPEEPRPRSVKNLGKNFLLTVIVTSLVYLLRG